MISWMKNVLNMKSILNKYMKSNSVQIPVELACIHSYGVCLLNAVFPVCSRALSKAPWIAFIYKNVLYYEIILKSHLLISTHLIGY